MKPANIFAICILLFLPLFAFGQEKEPDFSTVTGQGYLNKKEGSNNAARNSVNARESTRVRSSDWVQMFIALLFILFLIFLFFYLTRGRVKRNLIGSNGIDVIARASLLPKQSILVVRVGTRILILNAPADGHLSTLSEITDPEEINKLVNEVNQASRDNLFDSLLKRSKLLYDEETNNQEKELVKLEKETDVLQSKIEQERRV